MSQRLECPASTAVDAAVKAKSLRRLRKVEGQIRGIQQMITDERRCPQVLDQLAAAQSALRAVGREVLRVHLRHCADRTIRNASEQEVSALYDELIDLMYRNAR